MTKPLIFLLSICVFGFNNGFSKPKIEKIDSLTFSFGGGYTGSVTKYTITRKYITKKEVAEFSTSNLSVVRKLSKKNWNKIVVSTHQMFGLQSQFCNPSNITFYIQIYQKTNQKSFCWSDTDLQKNADLSRFQSTLLEIIKSLQF